MKYFLLIFLFFSVLQKGASQQYFTGLVFDDDSYQTIPGKVNMSRGEYDKLPESSSLKKYCPKPGNQIQFGTSVAWATSWGARTILEAKLNHWTNQDTITKNAFSPIFSYQLVKTEGDDFCSQGSTLNETLVKMKNVGAVKYIDFLEFCPKDIPEGLIKDAESKKLSDFVRLFTGADAAGVKINSVKKSIYEGYPVVIGMYCPPSFFEAKEFWQPKELMSKDFPGHALCVVGYDNKKFGGAFQVLNSWGRSWGNEGFTWIRYEDFVEFVKYAYELFLIEKSESEQVDYTGKASIFMSYDQELPLTLQSSGVYGTTKALRSGEKFRINISDFSSGYLYIIGTDDSKNVFEIFPYDKYVSPFLNYQINNISIPDDQHYIQLTGRDSKNILYLLFSRESLDIEFLSAKLEGKPDVYEELLDILGDDIISSEEINWEKDQLSFETKSSVDKIVLATINIAN